MKPSLKKTIIVYILKILYVYTSEEFPASQTAIVNYLNDIGIDCTRKTVGRNIGYLIEAGVPIKRIHHRNGGYYYDKTCDTFLAGSDI